MYKKILSLSILFLSSTVLAASWSDSFWAEQKQQTAEATVNFKVTVKKPACTIHVGDPPSSDRSVKLGTFPNKAKAVGPLVPVRFQFVSCNGPKTIHSISFTKDVPTKPNVTVGGPDHGWISTNNDGIRIYFYEDLGATIPFKSKSFGNDGHKIDYNEHILVFYARGQNFTNAPAPSGEFQGEAEFTVSYN